MVHATLHSGLERHHAAAMHRAPGGAATPSTRARCAGLVLAMLSLAACTVDRPTAAEGHWVRGQAGNAEARQTEMYVFAASSLAGAFGELAESFEKENPTFEINLNVGASTALREQILDGAPADVFASANEAVAIDLVNQDTAFASPVTFASNALVLVVPAENPGAVRSLSDLERASLFVGLCDPQVPCGSLAATAIAAKNVAIQVDTYEPSARSLTGRLIDGELDAGLVYATDAMANKEKLTVVDESVDASNRYPITARNMQGQLFADYVTSDDGQAILARWGFGAP